MKNFRKITDIVAIFIAVSLIIIIFYFFMTTGNNWLLLVLFFVGIFFGASIKIYQTGCKIDEVRKIKELKK
jgi:hypothetical protein